MTSTSQSRSLAGLPGRIGQLVSAPGDALARVETDGSGLPDALWLVALGVVTFRLPELCRVLLALGGPASGALLRVVGLFSDEAKGAAWVVLPAATIVTIAAGARRDATRDLDLGAACYAPYFALREVGRMLMGVAGARIIPDLGVEAVAGAGALVVLIRAIGVARSRPPVTREAGALAGPKTTVTTVTTPTLVTTPTPTPPGALAAEVPPIRGRAVEPDRRARVAGAAVMALALVSFLGNAVWTARHLEFLRPMRRGEPAPNFALPRIDGQPGLVTLEPLRGRVVVLDFWATWCPPCVAMLPVMDAAHRSWEPRGVSFLGLNSDGGGATRADIDAFLVEHPMSYPVALDSGEVGGLYKVEALPTLIVIGRDGTIRKSFVGYTSAGALDRALEDATREPPPAANGS